MLIEAGKLNQKAHWSEGVGARVILPSLILLGLGLIGLFWISVDIARDQDQKALHREEKVIATLLETKGHHWSKLALNYAFWDDAYEHLSAMPDTEWMDGNFDESVAESQGANAVVLIRPDLTAEAWFGETQDDEALKNAIGLPDLVADVLAMREKGPHFVHGIVLWRGQIALAGVARLMRQNSTVDDALPPKLVLFVGVLTPKETSDWSKSLQIRDMTLSMDPSADGPSLALKTRRGIQLGAIKWTSDAPGTSFLRGQLVLRTAIMIGLTAAFAILVLAWAAMMRRLSASAAKAEVLAESSRSKSAFLANMSHELRTPLNAIIGFSEIMKDEVFGPIGRPQYKDYAGHLNDSGKHLLKIINALLDVAKFEAGQFEQKPEPTTLEEIAKIALGAHRQTLEAGGLSVVTSGAGATTVIADVRSMARVFDAVLSNAAKFTPRGGQVEIALRDGRKPAILIRDTGCGIPPDKLEAIGRPFEQAADVLRRDHGGVGLGLAFARMLMEGQNGALGIESVVGEGTTITLEFTLASAQIAKVA